MALVSVRCLMFIYVVPFRYDNGGILVYVRSDIPSILIKDHVFSEINLLKSNWLVLGTYHPPGQLLI